MTRRNTRIWDTVLSVAAWLVVVTFEPAYTNQALAAEDTSNPLTQTAPFAIQSTPTIGQKSDTPTSDPLAEIAGVGGRWIVPAGTEMATRSAGTSPATKSMRAAQTEERTPASTTGPSSQVTDKETIAASESVPLPQSQTTVIGTIEDVRPAQERLGNEVTLSTEDGLVLVLVPPTTTKNVPSVGTKVRVHGSIEKEGPPMLIYATSLAVVASKRLGANKSTAETVDQEQRDSGEAVEATENEEMVEKADSGKASATRIVLVGKIKSARPIRGTRDLEITLSTTKYGKVRVLISPTVAERVPAVGSEIRVRGAVERQRDPMTVRAFDVETLRRRSDTGSWATAPVAVCAPVILPMSFVVSYR